MRLVRYRPNALNLFGNELSDLFNNSLLDNMTDREITAPWQPHADIEEEDECFHIKVDIPGVEPKDIQVSLENRILTVQGQRKYEKKENGRYERFSGNFVRSFTLPKEVEENAVKAKGKNGVLEIYIPKASQSVAKQITVSED